MITAILNAYGFSAADYQVEPFGPGLINHTFKVYGNADEYILQQLNTSVFKSPQAIAGNLQLIGSYLKEKHPGYLFAAPLPALNGKFLIRSDSGDYFRLLPFIKGSHTVNVVKTEQQAFEAAKQFGKFSRLLGNFDIGSLKYTLPDFHNLILRFEQFETSYKNATPQRLDEAATEIKEVYRHVNIINTYLQIVANNEIPLRVMHHDTKINNVLFDDNNNGMCVIDLDTIMPGYFLSDVGDMMRTYLSPVDEEEQDLSKIHVRVAVFNAIYKGYMLEMGDVLIPEEKQLFVYSGKMMIYMQALRFLTDFLNNDVYYGSKYPGHNLLRAQNQFTLLNKYIEAAPL